MDSQAFGWKKVAFRAHPLARLTFGNHAVARVGRRSEGLYIAHLAYRSHDQLRGKIIHGAAAIARTGEPDMICRHWRTGAALGEAELREAWNNVSTGRPDPRIDWPGLTDPQLVDLDSWREWEGPLLRRVSA